MRFEFPPDTKFAAIHLSKCSSAGLPTVLRVGERLSVHTAPILELTDFDKGRIGADYSDAFAKSNVVLVASTPSATPGVLDAESVELERQVHALFYGVLMQGVPRFWPGIFTLGSRQGNRDPWANSIAVITDFLRHGNAVPMPVTTQILEKADLVAAGLVGVFEPDSEFRRLRLGVNGTA